MNVDAKPSLEHFEPKPVKVLDTQRQMFGARFSPCGDFLISGGFDSHIHRWDTNSEDYTKLPSLNGHSGWTQALAFHPHDRLLFSGDSWGQLRCWSYRDPASDPRWAIAEAHDGWIRSLTVSPDGRRLASCGRDRRVRIFSTDNGRLIRECAGHSADVHCVAFHPEDGSVFSGDLTGVVKQWDLQTGRSVRDFDASALWTLHRLQDVGGVRVLAFDADSNQLLVAGTKPKNGGNVQGVPTILFFDAGSGQLKRTLELGKTSDVYVGDLLIHQAGFLMATTSGNPGTGKLVFQRPTDDAAFYTSTKMANCHAVSLHPDGLRLAVTTTNRGSNGNGRRLNKSGEYEGNTSPIHILAIPSLGQ